MEWTFGTDQELHTVKMIISYNEDLIANNVFGKCQEYNERIEDIHLHTVSKH